MMQLKVVIRPSFPCFGQCRHPREHITKVHEQFTWHETVHREWGGYRGGIHADGATVIKHQDTRWDHMLE